MGKSCNLRHVSSYCLSDDRNCNISHFLPITVKPIQDLLVCRWRTTNRIRLRQLIQCSNRVVQRLIAPNVGPVDAFLQTDWLPLELLRDAPYRYYLGRPATNLVVHDNSRYIGGLYFPRLRPILLHPLRTGILCDHEQ